MITKTIQVTQAVEVTVDETKFTPEFMAEFREGFYPFNDLDEHVEHIAQMEARGLLTGLEKEFIEGYGMAVDMGIKATVVDVETEVAIDA